MKTLFVILSIVLMVGCAPGDQDGSVSATVEARRGPIVVAAVNYPLAYFAERIGGDAVTVEFPSLAGDPAFWSPPPSTIVAFQDADLILRNGAGYAAWVDRASLPASRMVDTTAAHRDRLLAVDDRITHAHGPGGEHAHGGTAFTTWLDPTHSVEQARAILEALLPLLPESDTQLRDRFETRFETLAQELAALDLRLEAAVAQVPNLPLLGSHPVYQYLAQRYELNLRSVHWEPDEAPSPDMWREFELLLADHPARWMLWEGPPRAETIERLRAVGVESVVFDPCGNRPEAGDFIDVMERNAAALERATSSG
jgi:zinc transport system substrate-binding protein